MLSFFRESWGMVQIAKVVIINHCACIGVENGLHDTTRVHRIRTQTPNICVVLTVPRSVEYRVEGALGKDSYHRILQRHAIARGQHLIEANFTLQQENNPKHTSKMCR